MSTNTDSAVDSSPADIEDILPSSRRAAIEQKVEKDNLRFRTTWTDPMAMW